jgi:RNA polymerase sigma-70 factor (ECF subfamily)
MSVSIGPAWISVALMPRPPRSRARPLVRPPSADFGFADGPQAGLKLLEPLLGDPALERYQPLHAAHAELSRRAGHLAGATSRAPGLPHWRAPRPS